jgi:hypothetical protein
MIQLLLWGGELKKKALDEKFSLKNNESDAYLTVKEAMLSIEKMKICN